MEISLTKDSEKLICVIYKDYLEKRKSGVIKSDANYYYNSHVIHENLIPKWSFDDVDDTCRELSRAGLITCKWADNIAYHISTSDSGIIYMENRFKDGLIGVIDFLKVYTLI